MARYAQACAPPAPHEIERMKAAGATNGARLAQMRLAGAGCTATRTASGCREGRRRGGLRAGARAEAKLVAMREELRSLWTRTNVSAEQRRRPQAWCHKVEQSGIVALQEFSLKLRAARA